MSAGTNSDWPASLRLYGFVTRLAEPLAPLALAWRAGRGKEDRRRLGERLGRASEPRPNGPLVWIHAVSVGESLSHLPLVERFRAQRSEVTVLVTSGTRTAAELLAERLPEGVIHQFAPIDAPGAAARFIAHWKPDLCVFVESELWPNLLHVAKASGAKLVLMGARVSERSARRWDRRPAAARAVLGLFDLVYPQDSVTADWLEDHGIMIAGRLDLKRGASPLPCDEAALAELRHQVGDRKVALAASTHAGEEALIADAVRGLDPAPLLVVAPRHPERGRLVALSLETRGWTVALRSKGQPITPQTQTYIADTIGELGLFYRLADAVALGGSFLEGLAGHNPLEPARLGKAVVSGPHVDAFADLYAEFLAERAVLIAKDPGELAKAMKALLAEPNLAEALGERARAVAARGREDVEAAFEVLKMLLPGA